MVAAIKWVLERTKLRSKPRNATLRPLYLPDLTNCSLRFSRSIDADISDSYLDKSDGDWNKPLDLLADCLRRLPKVHTLDLNSFSTMPINFALQLAIIAHPNLQTLHFNRWCLQDNDLRHVTSRRPIGSPPLLVPWISLSYDRLSRYADHFIDDTYGFPYLLAGLRDSCNV